MNQTQSNPALIAAIEALGERLIASNADTERQRARWAKVSACYSELRKRVHKGGVGNFLIHSLADVQAQVGAWSRKNFDDADRILKFVGIVEECGELGHAILKDAQGIRGTTEEHAAAKRDAVGDMLIYLCDYCELEGLSLAACLEETWAKVRTRDWRKHPQKGRPLTRDELIARCETLQPFEVRDLQLSAPIGALSTDGQDLIRMWGEGKVDDTGKWLLPAKEEPPVTIRWRAGSNDPQVHYRCTTCGCEWRDNGDDTLSLRDADQTSCKLCEDDTLAVSDAVTFKT